MQNQILDARKEGLFKSRLGQAAEVARSARRLELGSNM